MSGNNYGIQGSVTADNVAVGPHATINASAAASVDADLAELAGLIRALPPERRSAAADALRRLGQAAAPGQRDHKSAATALSEIEGAARSSLGIAEVSEKILAIALRLGKVLAF